MKSSLCYVLSGILNVLNTFFFKGREDDCDSENTSLKAMLVAVRKISCYEA